MMMINSTGKVRVFLADDHPVVREGLKSLLNGLEDMEVVGEAADGEEALRSIPELRPDVVIIDVSMPKVDGGAATQTLKASCPESRVIALTVHEDAGYLKRMLDAGAAGYVLKRGATNALIDAIRRVVRGETYLDPALAGNLARMVRGQGSASQPGTVDLSDREEHVLRRIAQGFSNKEIAAQLSLSVKTIETYKARSLEKLGLRTRADIVRFAAHQGWLGEG